MTARVTSIRDRQAETQREPATAPATAEVPLSELSGWGRYPVARGRERRSADLAAITDGAALSRGLGRSYGDASLPAVERDVLAGSVLADRLLHFDPATGILRAEAGLSLRALKQWSMPRGWFTPVTPGTQFVTLGGMVAADVHGKMHHVDGCFGEHVTRLLLRVADGRVVECSDTQEPELFRATLGGMGLTGHILEVEFRMRRIPSPWIWQETEVCPTFDALLDAVRAASTKWPLTVSWADFLDFGPRMGRGLLNKGRWAEPSEAPPRLPRFREPVPVPPVFPDWFLQPWMGRLFNRFVYAAMSARPPHGIVHPESFFYPLDIVRDWNRLYGRRGFTQYQCLLPTTDGYAAHHRLLDVLRRWRAPSFVVVIKDCGAEGKGMLSFPKPGISYAIDMPVSAQTQALVDALNEVVIAGGGRVYLAKDAFTRAEDFRRMEPRLEAWQRVRRQWDPHGTLRSAQSVRVFGDTP
ncbi:MAG: FAD-binding oxidoreductase [Deltaproteobacteria bacterium]|nr:FAD-binding oxidoreductase [Deltaproteobacteria bacterium]MBI3389416.1 FAD-binding oxidoreductase [Deltaproteobacteria bacterium]